MTSPLRSLIASGTKLWLDSIDPDLVQRAIENARRLLDEPPQTPGPHAADQDTDTPARFLV